MGVGVKSCFLVPKATPSLDVPLGLSCHASAYAVGMKAYECMMGRAGGLAAFQKRSCAAFPKRGGLMFITVPLGQLHNKG